MIMSPPALSSTHADCPPPSEPTPSEVRRRASLPAVDERLVMPETRYEIINGKATYVPPADESHGTRHCKISAILQAYAAKGYDVAVDMLTRTSEKGDMAPDASVFPEARDPQTGGRQLEELVFEVVSTERLSHAAKKAQAFTARGVRRVFAVDVERRRALTWSRATNGWEILPKDGVIEDRALALPLPLHALVDAVRTDDAVARALLAKKNPVIEGAIREERIEAKREGKQEGKQEGEKLGLLAGKVAALLSVLDARAVRVSKKVEKRVRAEKNEATVDRWIARASVCSTTDEMFGD